MNHSFESSKLQDFRDQVLLGSRLFWLGLFAFIFLSACAADPILSPIGSQSLGGLGSDPESTPSPDQDPLGNPGPYGENPEAPFVPPGGSGSEGSDSEEEGQGEPAGESGGSDSSGGTSGGDGEDSQPAGSGAGEEASSNPVCDPLTSGSQDSSSDLQAGIRGEISYINSAAQQVYDFWTYDLATDRYLPANSVDGTVYMPKFDVPTRPFSMGFVPSGSSEALKKDDGNPLVENFSLRFESLLILPENYPEGRYEIAILSDDGSILYLNGQSVIDNDGNHPTRMGCQPAGASPLHLTQNSELELELLYYQGPRYHIALVVMWRLLSEDETAGHDSQCGKTGNHTWFNPDSNPIQPTSNYLKLLSDGWEVIPPSAFRLKNSELNPCAPGSDEPDATGGSPG